MQDSHSSLSFRHLALGLVLALGACYGSQTRKHDVPDGADADGGGAGARGPDGSMTPSGPHDGGSWTHSDAGSTMAGDGSAAAGRDSAWESARDAGSPRADAEPPPDAEPPAPDAGAVDHDFAAVCTRLEVDTMPDCSECTSESGDTTCYAAFTAFASECSAAELCYSRNCRLLIDAERCACAETCLPAGESRCKQLWAARIACSLDACPDRC
jgi:hypothetical protein